MRVVLLVLCVYWDLAQHSSSEVRYLETLLEREAEISMRKVQLVHFWSRGLEVPVRVE